MPHWTEGERKVAEMCVFGPDSGQFYEPLDVEIGQCASQLLHIATAFRHNLAATGSSVTLPFTLVWTGICDKRLHSLHLSEILRERARLVGTDDTINKSREKELATLASQRLEEELHVKPEFFGNQVFDILGRQLEHDDFAKAARELLRQCTVLLWGAIEVLVRDLHAEIVGSEMKGVKAALKALLQTEVEQQSLMMNLGIWCLSQERHVIVHCRSIIDAKFIEATGENLTVGSELVITAKRIDQRFQETRDAAVRILQSVRSRGVGVLGNSSPPLPTP